MPVSAARILFFLASFSCLDSIVSCQFQLSGFCYFLLVSAARIQLFRASFNCQDSVVPCQFQLPGFSRSLPVSAARIQLLLASFSCLDSVVYVQEAPHIFLIFKRPMLSLTDGGKNLEENTEENQAEIIVIENDAVRYSSSKDATFQQQVYQFSLSGLQTMVLCRVL